MNEPDSDYDKGRRPNVSYAEAVRAAIALLQAGKWPGVDSVRGVLGSGSPDTLANALKRFWRDLGIRIEGDPAALTRMPAEIADVADGLWQKALALASQAAKQDDDSARERLDQLRLENVDIRTVGRTEASPANSRIGADWPCRCQALSA